MGKDIPLVCVFIHSHIKSQLLIHSRRQCLYCTLLHSPHMLHRILRERKHLGDAFQTIRVDKKAQTAGDAESFSGSKQLVTVYETHGVSYYYQYCVITLQLLCTKSVSYRF